MFEFGWIWKTARGLPAIIALACLSLAAAAVARAEPAAHYQVSARMDADRGTIVARVVIDATVVSGETDFVLSDRLKLAGVDAGPGATVEIMPVDKPLPHLQRIAIRSAKAGRRRIVFSYAGSLGDPSAEDADFSPRRVELNLESMWLPVRQDLALTFTLDADITGLPNNLIVIAQGRFERSGDRLLIHRPFTDAGVTLAGAVGLQRITAPDVEFYAADPADPLIAMLRKHAFGAATFYRARFGAPPQGPVRMVIVPRGNGQGYAQRGFVVMPTFRKVGAPTPAFDESSPARFVAHEFRHAWGDTPSVVFADYWMSELVAEYFALRYVEATLGVAERDTMLARKRKTGAEAGPLVGATRPSGNALYMKGPVLLFDLEAQIGRPALDRILARPNPPNTTPAFLKALSREAGAQTARDFEAKLK